MKQIKLIDVANKAGVSKSTASQYINGRYEYMSEKTRKKLELAVNELGFVPNEMARCLRTKKSNTIGVVVSDITGPTTSIVLRGIDDYLKSQNYNTLIYNTDYQLEQEKKALANLEALQAKGLIITSSGKINDLLNDEDALGMSVVHIHRTFEDLNTTNVLSDFESGAYEATKYLISLGHKDIAIFTRPYENIPTRHQRIKGYMTAHEEMGLPVRDELIKILDYGESIEALFNELQNQPNPPSAVFSLYPRVTMEILDYCFTNHVSIPEDFSLISFDDLPMAQYFKTPITVVNQSSYELGVNAAKLLLKKIASPKEKQKDIILPCELIVRESCLSIVDKY